MKRLELQDQLFVEQAADAAKREAAIDRLGKCQKALLWLTLPAILIAAAALFLSDLPNSGLGLLGVVWVNLMLCNKLDSDRKLLLVLRRLEQR
jgi:hypothetical protein